MTADRDAEQEAQRAGFRAFVDTHKVGDVVTGSVLANRPYGMFVDLSGGCIGYIDVRHLADPPIEPPIGTEDTFIVASFEEGKPRVNLLPG